MNTTTAQVGFLKWVAKEHPAIYRRAVINAPTDTRLGALGWINELVQAIATVGSAVMGKKQIDQQVNLQKKALALSDAQAAADRDQQLRLALLEVNTKRAQQGLGPVDLTGKPINTAVLPMPSALQSYASAAQVLPATLIPGVPNVVTYVGGALLGVGILRALKLI